MGKKRKAAAAPEKELEEQPAAKQARGAGGQPHSSGAGAFKNKEKVLVLSSRGITFRWGLGK